MNTERLKATLIEDEDLKLFPYWDTADPPKCTIGVGHNLTDNGITRAVAMSMLKLDMSQAHRDARKAVTNFDDLNAVRQEVVINMVFNMGLPTFQTFKNTIKAIEKGDFDYAAIEMLDSLWSKQVKGRADRLARRMRTGEHA